jgi:hypothetical protein
MSNLEPVPFTITATERYQTQAQMAIGKNQIPLPGQPSGVTGGYWVVVVDRTTLHVVYNKIVETSDKAPDIGKYDTPAYLLFITTMWLGTGFVPQGALYDFLMDNGAGRHLKRVVQLNNTLGCGNWSTVAYCLAGVLGPGVPAMGGVELGDIATGDVAIVMTAQLVPIQVGSTVLYTPSPLGD